MVDFSNLGGLEIRPDRTVDFRLYHIPGEPVLKVAPATEANKPYYNKLLQRSGGAARRIRAVGVSAAMVEENRENDRDLYAQHVIRGWEGIKDASGAVVPFSPGVARDFLAALPSWLFDELRTFCGEASNFVERGSKDAAQTEESAKNS